MPPTITNPTLPPYTPPRPSPHGAHQSQRLDFLISMPFALISPVPVRPFHFLLPPNRPSPPLAPLLGIVAHGIFTQPPLAPRHSPGPFSTSSASPVSVSHANIAHPIARLVSMGILALPSSPLYAVYACRWLSYGFRVVGYASCYKKCYEDSGHGDMCAELGVSRTP